MQQGSQDRRERPVEALEVDMGASLDSLVNVVEKGIVNEMQSYGISPLELGLLKSCMEREGCTATQLAELLPIDSSRISRVVNRLVDMGLLRRNRLRRDRRVVILTLTMKGSELTAEASRRVRDYYASLMEGVSEEEIRTSLAVVSKILANHAALVQAEQDASGRRRPPRRLPPKTGGGGGESNDLFPVSSRHVGARSS